MRSPPGSLATKPPPTPMAKLQDDIQEIDILLEASKRARESVADRAKGLYEEHLATQRKFDQDMQRETLSKKPGGMAGPRADHALMFHLGGNTGADAVPSAPGTATVKRKKINRYRRTPSCPHRRPTLPTKKRREWDDYYRYCARGALFKAPRQGRMTELELGQELAKIAFEAESYRDTATTRSTTTRRRRKCAHGSRGSGMSTRRLGKSKKALQGSTKLI